MSDGAGSLRLSTHRRQALATDHDVAVDVVGLRSDPSTAVASGLDDGGEDGDLTRPSSVAAAGDLDGGARREVECSGCGGGEARQTGGDGRFGRRQSVRRRVGRVTGEARWKWVAPVGDLRRGFSSVQFIFTPKHRAHHSERLSAPDRTQARGTVPPAPNAPFRSIAITHERPSHSRDTQKHTHATHARPSQDM